MRPGIFIPCQAKHDAPRRRLPSPSRIARPRDIARTFLSGECGRIPRSAEGRNWRSSAPAGCCWSLVASLGSSGIFFLPFLCIGVPLLIVGLILAVAESGQVTRRASFPYPGYGPAYPYFQYPSMPPASPPPRPPDVASTSPAPPPTPFCVSCGSALTESAAFCARCGAPVQR